MCDTNSPREQTGAMGKEIKFLELPLRCIDCLRDVYRPATFLCMHVTLGSLPNEVTAHQEFLTDGFQATMHTVYSCTSAMHCLLSQLWWGYYYDMVVIFGCNHI